VKEGLTAEESLWVELPREGFLRDRLITTYARQFFALAAAHRVPVFCLIPPLPPSRQRVYDRSGVTHYSYVQAWRTLAAAPGVTVIDGSHSGYDSSVFWNDEVHLDRRGALAFTAEVGSIVARSLARPQSAPRWVRLPAYREPEGSVAAEDVFQSLLAVQANGSRRPR
jgi:hypothetical protein